MVKKGDSFEKLTKVFAEDLFRQLGYKIVKIRKQWSRFCHSNIIRLCYLPFYIIFS